MAGANSIRFFDVKDPKPESKLEDILPVSIRALSLLARNKTKPILDTNYVEIVGAIDMLEALDYHFTNFMKATEQLKTNEAINPKNLDYEAVAYINRLGQFYYFTESAFVKNII